MNGRAVKKHLMKNRINSIFGRRAYLALRLPLDVFPDVPDFDPIRLGLGEKHDFLGGAFVRRDDNGLYHLSEIQEVHSGGDPRKRHGPEDPTPFFVEEDSCGYQWWEATVEVYDKDPNDFSVIKENILDTYELPEDIVKAYKNINDWKDRYLGLAIKQQEEVLRRCPYFERLFCAVGEAKSSSLHIENGYAYYIFGVKYFHFEERDGFCANIGQATKEIPGARVM